MNSRFITKDPVQSRRGSALRLTDLATFMLDLNGRIIQWSSGAGALFSHTCTEAVGQLITDLLINEEDHGRVKEALAHVVVGQRWVGVLSSRHSGEIEFRWDPLTCDQIVVSACPAMSLRMGDSAATQQRLTLLNEASQQIGSTLDMGQTARELMDLAVPRFADAAGILVQERLITEDAFPERATDGSAVVRRLAVAVAAPNPEDWEKAFPVDEVTVYPEWTPYAQCMATGHPVLFSTLDTPTAVRIGRVGWRREAVVRVLDHVSMLIVPLRARGKVLGFAVFTRRPGSHPFEQQDVALAEELAARTGVCIDNSRLYNRERRTALTLQSSLLPTNLDAPVGLEIAHRYRPASDMYVVGGDWYDVIPLPGSRVALVVGDVMGHGTRAAATMGQLRTAVRTLASLDLAPAQVLYRLDQMTQDLDATQIATCVYATYDPVTRDCAIARAGHVPPILMRPDGERSVLELPAGLPLGIGGEPFEARELRLDAGSTLVFCTDGLVESRDRDIDTGMGALIDGLAHQGRSLEETCDAIIDALLPDQGRDDTALLLAQVHALTPEQTVAWTLDADPRSPRQARARVRSTLAAWELTDLTETVELLASELVTNAVRYATEPFQLRLLRGQTALLCQLADSSGAAPVLHSPEPTDEDGRGMQLVNLLTQRWGTHSTATGKIVWCELPIPEHLRPPSA